MKFNLLFLSLDDIMVLEFIGYSLEESLGDTSIGILEASNKDEAIHMLESQKVDLIISDMDMETLQSFEFYEKIKLDNEYKHIPFVFLSSLEEDQNTAAVKEIEHLFVKPLDVDHLLQTLHTILSK